MRNFNLFVLLLLGISLIVSCGKPKSPEEIEVPDFSGGYKIVKKLATTGYSQDVLKKDNFLYMAQGEGGLLVVDVSNPENPQEVSITTKRVRGYCSKIAMRDSVVYLSAGAFGLNVIKVLNPYEPVIINNNLGERPNRNLHINGDYMYTAVSEQGINIASIANPDYPQFLGNTSTSGYASGIATIDTSYAFIACGEMGLSMLYVPDSLFDGGYPDYKRVGWCDTPGYAEDVIIKEDISTAFLACGTAGLQIIDYSDTTNLHIVGSYDGGGYAKELMYQNDKIYMTAELSGLQIIDVSDATNPYLIGEVDTEFALGVEADENYIYLADEDEGLIIISIPN